MCVGVSDRKFPGGNLPHVIPRKRYCPYVVGDTSGGGGRGTGAMYRPVLGCGRDEITSSGIRVSSKRDLAKIFNVHRHIRAISIHRSQRRTSMCARTRCFAKFPRAIVSKRRSGSLCYILRKLRDIRGLLSSRSMANLPSIKSY